MNKRTIILLAVTGVLIVILAIVLFNVFYDGKETIGKEVSYNEYTILEGHSGSLKDYDNSLYIEGYKGNYSVAYYITGTLKSNEEEKQNFVEIRFNLYDSKGKIIGEAIAGVNDVSKDNQYTFTAMSLTSDDDAKKVVKYELKSIVSK